MNHPGPLDYTRQRDIVDPARLAAVHVDLVGCGAINSPTGLVLAKMGCTDLRAIDFGRVEPVNVSGQIFRLADARAHAWKAEALRDIYHAFAGVEVQAACVAAADVALRGVVVMGVDSMAARQAIWEQVLASPTVSHLIDGRMGATNGMVLTVRLDRPADRRAYESSLYDDDRAVDLPCTGRTVLYNTFWIAALIARQVSRIASEQSPPEYRVDFDLANLSLLVEA